MLPFGERPVACNGLWIFAGGLAGGLSPSWRKSFAADILATCQSFEPRRVRLRGSYDTVGPQSPKNDPLMNRRGRTRRFFTLKVTAIDSRGTLSVHRSCSHERWEGSLSPTSVGDEVE